VKGEGGRQLLAIILHTLLQVLTNKDLFSRGVPKIGNHVNVILYRKNLLKIAEVTINGCI
jgi:hypothetical protein